MIAGIIILLAAGSGLRAQVPQLINYQGRVAVTGTNFNGSGQFEFALVDSTGTNTYWSNDGTSIGGKQPTNAVSLNVTNGYYSLDLGDTTLPNMAVLPYGVFSNTDVRLRVWFNDGTHGWQMLSPDQRIVAVGYAISSASSTASGSAANAGYAVSSGSSVFAAQSGSSTISGSSVNGGVTSINGMSGAVTIPSSSGTASILPAGATLSPGAVMAPSVLYINGDSIYAMSGSAHWPPGFTGNTFALSNRLYTAPSGAGNDWPSQLIQMAGTSAGPVQVYNTAFSDRVLSNSGYDANSSVQTCLSSEVMSINPYSTKVSMAFVSGGGINDLGWGNVSSGTVLWQAQQAICSYMHGIGVYPIVAPTILPTGIYPIGGTADLGTQVYNALLLSCPTGQFNTPDVVVNLTALIPGLAATGTTTVSGSNYYTFAPGTHLSDNIHPSASSNTLLAAVFLNAITSANVKPVNQLTGLSGQQMGISTLAPWNYEPLLVGNMSSSTSGSGCPVINPAGWGHNNSFSMWAPSTSGSGWNSEYIQVDFLGGPNVGGSTNKFNWAHAVGFNFTFQNLLSNGSYPTANWLVDFGKTGPYGGLPTTDPAMGVLLTGSGMTSGNLAIYAFTGGTNGWVSGMLGTLSPQTELCGSVSANNGTLTVILNGTATTFTGVAPTGTIGSSCFEYQILTTGLNNTNSFIYGGPASIWTQ